MNRYAMTGGHPFTTTSGGSAARGLRLGAPKTGRWALVGRGALAEALAAAWPYRDMGLVQWPEFSRDAPAVDGVLEAVSGVTPALDVALTALARGVPLVTSNALLLATHGQMLQAAARMSGSADGQAGLLGMEGALLGSLPVGGLFQMYHGLEGMVASFGGAADLVVQRMRYRGESAAQAEQAVKLSLTAPVEGVQDLGGKQTLVKAIALHGLWRQAWLNPAQQVRQPAEVVLPADVRRLQGYGLGLRYGAVIKPGSVSVGPLAVADGMLATEGQTLVLETSAGMQTLTTRGAPLAGMVNGMLHDVARLAVGQQVARAGLERRGAAFSESPAHYYVRVNAADDGKLVSGNRWPVVSSGGVVIPVAGAVPEAAAAGVRRAA